MAIDNEKVKQISPKIAEMFSHIDLPTLQKFYQMATQALQNPQSYPQLLQAAIQSGKVKQGELPEQFDEKVVKNIVFALQIAMEQKKSGQGGQQQQPIQMPKSI